ncbi:hypothetical protein Hanom_Chr02g00128141 [Helianthus anomalus]
MVTVKDRQGPVEKSDLDFDTGYQNPYNLLRCVMAKKDKASETIKNWPKLINVKDYADWKKKFVACVQSEDSRMWSCMIDAYITPTYEVDGRIRVTSYERMQESEKQMFDAEKKVLTAIKMSLPFGIKHSFNRYGTSRELWEALEKCYQISSRPDTCDQASLLSLQL